MVQLRGMVYLPSAAQAVMGRFFTLRWRPAQQPESLRGGLYQTAETLTHPRQVCP